MTARALANRLPAGFGAARRALVLMALGAAALVVVGFTRLALSGPAAVPGSIPENPAVEQQYGIRVTQVGVSADGGLVDVRYVILDPAKAALLTETERSVPRLVVQATGQVVHSAALMGAKHDLRPGRTAFLLYRNTQGRIQRGTELTIDFGDLRIEHVVAE